MTPPRWRRLEPVALAGGALLRLYLALVNTQANDDHLSVIRIIAHEHRFPHLREAWEGFQPKLYHSVVALLWDLSPWQSAGVQVRIAQLVSCAAGIATLFILYRALARETLAPAIRFLALALVAFNPTLIGLSVQATNDAFVILFGTLALSAGAAFLRSGSRREFFALTIAVILALLSKGNGLVIFAAAAATLALGVLRLEAVPGVSRGRLAALTAAFTGLVVASAIVLGPYRANREDTGDPFAINGDKAPLPHFIERTYVFRPGTTSIVDTYLTFRLVDLLEHPVISNDVEGYPLHRTSLWSQLYGRAHFVHFAQHPPSWRTTHPVVLWLGRFIFLAALWPTALLLAGMARSIVAVLTPGRSLETTLFTLAGVGYFLFIILYSLVYRDFSTMKAEFLFPALLPYVTWFAREAGRWESRWPRLGLVTLGSGAALLVLYLADIAILARQLT
jgi:hypothetical protein